jgi:hypothetical protein
VVDDPEAETTREKIEETFRALQVHIFDVKDAA